MKKTSPGLRAMIIEKDKSQRKGIALALMDFCSDIKLTGNPGEALELAEKEVFDIVVTEIQFATEDGLEIVKNIRQRLPEAVVIVWSAYLSLRTQQRLKNIGVQEIIEKPINLDRFKQRVQSLLSGDYPQMNSK